MQAPLVAQSEVSGYCPLDVKKADSQLVDIDIAALKVQVPTSAWPATYFRTCRTSLGGCGRIVTRDLSEEICCGKGIWVRSKFVYNP